MAWVFLTRTSREALAALDFLRADAVLDALGEVERDPHLGHQLRGRLSGLRSHRVGAYRIIYELRDDKTVRVVAIRHRGDAYGTDRAEHRASGTQRPNAMVGLWELAGRSSRPTSRASAADRRARTWIVAV